MKLSLILKQYIVEFAHQAIEEGSTIASDKYRSYNALATEGYQHKPTSLTSKKTQTTSSGFILSFPMLKPFIEMALRMGVRSQAIFQAYLNEVCYRFNRRNSGEMSNPCLKAVYHLENNYLSELGG